MDTGLANKCYFDRKKSMYRSDSFKCDKMKNHTATRKTVHDACLG